MLKETIRRNTGPEAARFLLGSVYWSTGGTDDSIAELERACELNPGYARDSIASDFLARTYY